MFKYNTLIHHYVQAINTTVKKIYIATAGAASLERVVAAVVAVCFFCESAVVVFVVDAVVGDNANCFLIACIWRHL